VLQKKSLNILETLLKPIKIGDAADEILQQADIAMYKAKQLGTDNFQRYQDYMGEDATKSLRYEKEIEQALANQYFYAVPAHNI